MKKTDFNPKETNKKILIILGLFGGVILIILSFFTASGSSGNNGGANQNQTRGNISDLAKTDTAYYIAEQERKLYELLKRIDGVSEPFVMIVLETSSEYIYATKQSIKESSAGNNGASQRDVQRELILVEDERRARTPVLVKEIKPKIKGVAVVCKGIGSADMQLKIINLVSTVLNLPTNRVYVISAD